MDSTAILFWVGMAALLAVAVILGRWHKEEVTRRIGEAYGGRVVIPRIGAPVRPQVSSHGVEPTDAALPDGAERAPA
jgi:hypothetical protein